MKEKKRVALPIIVEGRYDKSTLSSMFEAKIITTDGFGIFNSKEKQALIKKIAERGGVILLTDSDAGGRQIRSFLSGIIPKEKIFHLYIPKVEGKEKRKKSPSKSGLLGVEGMDRAVLESALAPFIEGAPCKEKGEGLPQKSVTKADFFADGLTGTDGASEKRRILAEHLGLPGDMSANALISALNLCFGYGEYKNAVSLLFGTQGECGKSEVGAEN